MSAVGRRAALQLALSGAAASACTPKSRSTPRGSASASASPGIGTAGDGERALVRVEPLPQRPPWPTEDPFLFCVHHRDAYPQGNAALGPAAPLAGRRLGHDFSARDGWSMYHGEEIPGFPQHPHRGFETITVVKTGLLDHADSLGAAARYGDGDVQWLTAGEGIIHAEMFPLLRGDAPNPTEFFQLWLNLPRANKMAKPHFKMLWADRIPRLTFTDGRGNRTRVDVHAGAMSNAQGELVRPPSPPPNSWGANPEGDVRILTVILAPSAQWTLPGGAGPETVRSLYFYRGAGLRIGQRDVPSRQRIVLRGAEPVTIQNRPDAPAALLLLQGRPIGEPVVKYGPFVMNTQDEIRQAYADYRATQFGGWPWRRSDPVHGREPRFARHADGALERPA
ncbi:MAG: pirin family protein [Myxococcota bacterium]